MPKYKVSFFQAGKIKKMTVTAKNMDGARISAAKKSGKAHDVGYFSVNRIKK